MPLTWRGIIADALDRIERVDPSDFTWFRRLKCNPSVFDKWLNTQLQAISLPESSPFPVRKRPTGAEVRRVVQDYVDEARKYKRNTAIPGMWEYVKKKRPNATRDQAIKALRAIEGGPKGRGRPRLK
jgi:hypothetical protein